MEDEQRRIRTTKAYALAIGFISFSIPGAAALADVYGAQDKKSIVLSYSFLIVCMILWVLHRGGID
jgi:hypothetical protein